MPPEPSERITRLLAEVSAGNQEAIAELTPLVYAELRSMASRLLRGRPAGQTLRTTALVHEAYVKLVDQTNVHWEGRAHFFGVASKAMRSIMVDYARSRQAAKRGGDHKKIPLDRAMAMMDERNIDLIALDEALTRLGEFDDRMHRVVELRYFGNLTLDETAGVLDVSTTTVERDWRMAKAWLKRELEVVS